MNSVQLLGNLTRDPELRFTPNNTAVCNFGIAINEGKDKTTFVDVECWQKTAELVNQYWHKGKQIALSGRLQLDQWEQDGKKRSKLKVVAERVYFVGSKNDSPAPASQPRQSAPQANHQPLDDESIPF